MLRLLSFILALGGLAVSALGIWLMMGNELPTDWLPKTEAEVERKLYAQGGTTETSAPETSEEEETPPPTPAPLPEPIEAETVPEAIVDEALEAIESPPIAGAPVQVMPTPMKDKQTGTTTRSLSNGDTETVVEKAERHQPAFIEPPVSSETGEETFEISSVDLNSIETAAGPAPAPPPTLNEQLRSVPIAYETPKTAAFNSTFTVTLAIDAREDATTATGGLSGSVNTNIAEAEVRVSELVTANLIGVDEAFEIVPEFDAPQKLSKSTESVWRWKVTPLKSGPQKLKFEIFAVDERNIQERLLSFDDTVTVEVSRIGQAMFLAQQYNPIVVILAGFGSLLAGIFGVLRFFKS